MLGAALLHSLIKLSLLSLNRSSIVGTYNCTVENARGESSETVVRLESSCNLTGQCLYCCRYITILHSTVLASPSQIEINVHLRFTLGSPSTSLSSIPFQPVYHLVTSSKFGLLLSHADNTCTAEREGRFQTGNAVPDSLSRTQTPTQSMR